MSNRIIANGAMGVCILFAPWWVSILLFIVFIVLIRNPYEILGWGLFMDSLYGFPGIEFFFLGFITWGVIVAFIISFIIKERLLVYNR